MDTTAHSRCTCLAMQVTFLEGLGIPSQSVCNMASMVPKILGVQESAAKEVVDYLKGKGLSGVSSLPAWRTRLLHTVLYTSPITWH